MSDDNNSAIDGDRRHIEAVPIMHRHSAHEEQSVRRRSATCVWETASLAQGDYSTFSKASNREISRVD